MIVTENLVKRFGAVHALDGLNLHVPKGSIYGLVGPNGAGKSTLIRHLTGVLRPDSGSVEIDGQPVYENPALKARIAYIPDDIFYFRQANLRDMMRFYQGLYPNFDRAMFGKLQELFELDQTLHLRRFSKGMQKQAAFWLALCTRPDILILDEPVDGLDPVVRRKVWSLLMAQVAERGITVLVSSHNLRELEDVCDRVGIMLGGKMLLERSLEDLQENIVKVQYVPAEGSGVPQGLDVVHESRIGQVRTLIVRGQQQEVLDLLTAENPLFFDVLPLTLEEIFIYELGGAEYDVKNILV